MIEKLKKTQIELTPGEPEFVITHVVDAPKALVYRAWTDADEMAGWWGPHGFINPVSEFDVRVGGKYRIVMRSPEGDDYSTVGVFSEVVENRRLVFTQSFEEFPLAWHTIMNEKLPEDERPLREGVMTVTFESVEGKTLLTIRERFVSIAQRGAVLQIGAPDYWSESLERLDAQLVEAVEPEGCHA